MSASADDDNRRLVKQLLLEAGRTMEDSSPEFALTASGARELDRRIVSLERTAADLLALASAARSLRRRVPSG
ncbi:hypothetical protein [Altericroceibacterium xinjiangense]|uniref:hypothetical protein n=1 Tax=Altericroceibacterium xinjiangense TaxID=762261 RepID=UPI000F7F4ED8|nr:hypothetical protein [Altericroceibacterium xinjiangense]